ncbi:MAG: hypothetical protein CMQ20_05685 [Gammaproteobacteria bacterium]|jgi:outer membrane protein assembly factor BamC|nr:hypothetical protein [Gammaproteobacteria bacterium]|tara:strand:- start:1443 stop:2528 length:1086 start_codon:yes stop_codon:yes gene_type:complete
MKHLPITLLLLTLIIPGCSWFGAGEIRESLEKGSSKPVEIPEGLDQPKFVDAMHIPEVLDSRGLAGVDYEVGLPEALSTRFGVEPIVIKKLGDDRWIFLDMPPAAIWPKVVQFWEANNLLVEDMDPGTGILTSRWLPARDGTPEEIFSSLKQGDVFSNSTGVGSHKFRLRVEPGIRTGSTEIYLEHRAVEQDAPFRVDQLEWDGNSDNLELEGEILTVMAYYLGENVSQGTVSLLATGIQESRSQLIPDRERPVLKYRLDFNRAWATVGNALENARVSIEDLDRTSANYYVYYSSEHSPDPGFFKRVFSRGKKKLEGGENRYTVHLDSEGEEVHVTVFKDTVLAESLIAERLLKVIKEYST